MGQIIRGPPPLESQRVGQSIIGASLLGPTETLTAGYLMVTVGGFDRSGWITTVIVFLFLLMNYANYGLLSGVNAAEGGSGGPVSYSLAFLWLVLSLILAGLTKKAYMENKHIDNPDNRVV